MRIAHLSDLHLLSLRGAVPFRLLNKRLTGYVNLRFHRKSVHHPSAVRAAARAIRELDVDHVVITGDVSNLALEQEFELVRAFLDEDLGMPPDRVSIVPGNHDAYTRGAHRSGRFHRFFEPYISSDLPLVEGPFPYVRLREHVAIIGLTTARPRPPFVASGTLGREQVEALRRAVEHPEVASRVPVILQHHPWHNPPSYTKVLFEGLYDAASEATVLRGLRRGVLLHGHLHRRLRRRLPTDEGYLDAIGATSASLLHESDERMAGFNVYEIARSGKVNATSHRLVPETETFREVSIPA